MAQEYLLSHHKVNIMQILQDVEVKKHYSISISFVELFEDDTNLGNNILKNPEEALHELEELIVQVQNNLIEQLKDENLTLKLSVHARVYGLPVCPELHRNVFPKNEDLNAFLQVTGTVVRVTATKMLEYQRPYICTKCKYVQTVEAIYNQKYIIIQPKKCLNPENCPGTNMISVNDLNVDNCKDYQEVKIQEQSSKLGVGTMPRSMWVTLEDDLVDACKPGDDVTICGVVKRRWGALVFGKRIEAELVLKANHIQVNNGQTSPSLITPEVREQFISFWEKYKSRPLEGRDVILKSFCPKLYGMYVVKLAMAVVLAGGSRCTQGNEVGIQIRSEPHILLVGDPGTGKSQLLRYAAKVIPRSVLTTGVGTTSAGLTVAAVMEDGQWQLEGGALVLADGGICCIDEFNSMKSHDRTSIHEAMEQQTISVAKASMVCKLRTRCSILAATNPKGGHLDPSQPLSLNLTLPSPLLSRFDVVLMLKDCYDNEWDNLVADYILSAKGDNAIKIDANLWNLEALQQYFTIIRSINPVLTSSANKILSSYYQAQRRAISRNKARTTVRLLDSLVRLSQAHARLMFHTEVHVMDALFAVFLIESSMHGECAVLSLDTVNVQAPFITTPMENYAQLATSVLRKLGLHDIFRGEVILLNSGYQYNHELYLDEEDKTETNTTILEESSLLKSQLLQEQCNTTHDTNLATNIETDHTEIDNENTQKNGQCQISETADIIDPQLLSKFKFVNKREVLHKQTNINPNENDNSSNKICEIRKRKTSEPNEHSKNAKAAKKTSDLNDFQMLNLIRSANDEFDPNILNFLDDESNNTVKNKEITFDFDENSPVVVGNISTEIENKNYSPNCVNNKAVNDEQNEQKPSEGASGSFEFLKTVENFSQNSKLRRFREKFAYKPKNITNLGCEQTDKADASTDENGVDNLNQSNAMQHTPQTLFNSQEQDYDSLDLEF